MSVLTTFILVIGNDEKVVVRMPCIYYPIRFQEEQVRALLDSGNKVNAMNPDYT